MLGGGFKLRFAVGKISDRQAGGYDCASFEMMCAGCAATYCYRRRSCLCMSRRNTSNGRHRRGRESAQRFWGYDGGGKQYIRLEKSFYRNKVLLDNSAEYGREVKDLGWLGEKRCNRRMTERERK